MFKTQFKMFVFRFMQQIIRCWFPEMTAAGVKSHLMFTSHDFGRLRGKDYIRTLTAIAPLVAIVPIRCRTRAKPNMGGLS